jgi:predicted Zn-dependent protease
MVIEHTFVTTSDAQQALGLASSLLTHAGFVAKAPSPGGGFVAKDPSAAAESSGAAVNVIEMMRARAGQKGSVACLQNVRVEYDRGRVGIAASIVPRTRGRSAWSATTEPAATSEAGRPFADAMILLSSALEQALVLGTGVEQAVEPWRAQDALLPARSGRRKVIRRCIVFSCLGIIGISVVVAMGRLGARNHGAGAGPILKFPENEDPRPDAAGPRDTFAQERTEQLRAEADAELRNAKGNGTDNVSAVFGYAERLAQIGAPLKAVQYYKAALKYAPHDYPHHLSYAELLNRQKQPQAALSHITIALMGAEDVALVQKAQAMLGAAHVDAPPLTALAGGKAKLVLVPMGDVDLMLLEGERKKLQEELGIEVQLRSAAMSFSVSTRNPLKEAADLVRADFDTVRKKDPKLFAMALQYLGLTENDLLDDAKVVSLGAFLRRRQGRPELAAQLDALGDKSETQWAAEAMVEGFTAAVRPFAKPNVRFLGITRSDLFGENVNFWFGYRVGDYGIVSYHRFTASFNKETPDRTRLARRLHLQVLASAGHVFGLEHCSDPTCPRSYPNSLAEHDAKSNKLCENCRKGFDAAFGRSGGR